MTNQKQSPEPIAELSFEELTTVLFNDGAIVTLGVGDWSCSEHTGPPSGLPIEECDHYARNLTDVPSFEGKWFQDAAATDRMIQNEVLSRLAENDPERLVEFTEKVDS